jgi:outer membrane immunogenic protein
MSYALKSSLAVSILALLSTGAANATDLPGSTKDSPSYYAPESGSAISWTGFYIGGRAGYGNANHDLTVQGYGNEISHICGQEEAGCEPGDKVVDFAAFSEDLFNLNGLNSAGFVGGGQVGFDVQRGRFVGGVFGSYDFSNAETTVSGFEMPEIALIEQGDSWSVGARAGLLVNPRTLLYVLAAYSQGEFTFAGEGEDGATSKDVTFDGITAGAGIEFALAQNVFLGIEGTHTWYDSETLGDSCDGVEECGGGVRLVDEIGETRVMGTLKMKLNTGILGN